jgi:L-ascorbate metabolism protein UlaG (beta-lactamase superfamily)
LVIYLDPWQLKGGAKADIILITHDHYDHDSPEDVSQIQKEDTVVVTTSQAAAKLKGQIKIVKPGEQLTVKSVFIETVPAYNVNKFRSLGVPFHSHEAGHVGFIVTVGGMRIYHAGDSDLTPEMKSVRADVALLPVSGIYVMTAEEAIQAAKEIRPTVAVPMHVGRGIGNLSDAERFKKGLEGVVRVEILPLF